ncbi:MAG: hypothetical protein ABIJ48_10370 [Actinomycetota bacterium]
MPQPTEEEAVASTDEVRAKVRRILQNKLGNVKTQGDDFFVRHGSTGCRLTFHEVDRVNLVNLSSPILFEVPLTPALYEEVARRTGKFRFGSICLREEKGKGNLFFEGALIGDTLDEDELMFPLVAIVTTADRLDDEFRPRFGGRRLEDRAAR